MPNSILHLRQIRRCLPLGRILKRFGHLPVSVLFKIFDCKILPILLYGCEMWGIAESTVIERIHLKFCRYSLRISKTASNPVVRGELGRNSLLPTRIIYSVTYWLYIISLSPNRYLQQCYNFQLNNIQKRSSMLGEAKSKVFLIYMVSVKFGLLKVLQTTIIFFKFLVRDAEILIFKIGEIQLTIIHHFQFIIVLKQTSILRII